MQIRVTDGGQQRGLTGIGRGQMRRITRVRPERATPIGTNRRASPRLGTLLAGCLTVVCASSAAWADNPLLADIERLEQRVEAGDAHAMTKLAARLQGARGVPRDLERARALYARAAELGDAEAQYNLGNMYLLGEGVPADEAQAIRYYKMAADGGHPIAAANLEQLLRVVTPPGPAPSPVAEVADGGVEATDETGRSSGAANVAVERQAPLEPVVARTGRPSSTLFPSGRAAPAPPPASAPEAAPAKGRDARAATPDAPGTLAAAGPPPTEPPADPPSEAEAAAPAPPLAEDDVAVAAPNASEAGMQPGATDPSAPSAQESAGGGTGGFLARLFGTGQDAAPAASDEGPAPAVGEAAAAAPREEAVGEWSKASAPAQDLDSALAEATATATDAPPARRGNASPTPPPASTAAGIVDMPAPDLAELEPLPETSADAAAARGVSAEAEAADVPETVDLMALDASNSPASGDDAPEAVDPDDEREALELARARGISVLGPTKATGPKTRSGGAAAPPSSGRTGETAVSEGTSVVETAPVTGPSRAPLPGPAADAVVTGIGRSPETARGAALETWRDIREALESGAYDRAVPDLERLAAAGDPDAQFELAELYRAGSGVTEDEAMAITHLRAAARGGHHAAQRELTVIYEAEGLELPRGWSADESPAPSAEPTGDAATPTFDRSVATAASDAEARPAEALPEGRPISASIDRTSSSEAAAPDGGVAEGAESDQAATPARIETRPPPGSARGVELPGRSPKVVTGSRSEPPPDARVSPGSGVAAADDAPDRTPAGDDAKPRRKTAPGPAAAAGTPAATAPRGAVETAGADRLSVEASLAAAKLALSRGAFERAAAEFSSAAEAGNAEAQAHLGYMYYAGEGVERDPGEAVAWYRRAAAQGNRDAQYNLGVAYAYGEGVAMDKTEAIRWYRRAAEGGSAVAQYSLGVAYALGEGVDRDDAEAAAWYRRAAEAGYPAAQYNLAYCYRAGKGVPRDDERALEWFLAAAENGHLAAKYTVAGMYQTGVGTTTDRAKAIDWYRVAAAEGHAGAAEELERLLADGG